MKRKRVVNVLRILSKLLLIISFIIFIISLYISTFFTGVTFEQLLYSIVNFKGTNLDVIFKGLIVVILICVVLCFICKLFKYLISKINYRIILSIKFKDKNYNVNFKTVFKTLLIITFLFSSYKLIKIDEYVNMILNSTDLYEKYYVDARDVKLSFPDKKRNLIFIYLESMEMTNASISNGGFMRTSYIPNLEELALNNINFSNTDTLGGDISVYGTNYTSASLVAHTAGIPLKVSIGWRNYKNYGKSIPGVYNLGDILEDNGYNNYFMIGSDADYGGRKDYFRHGNYTIYDYYWAIDEGLIDKDYHVWWGYEDLKLFEFAKDKLSEISKNDEPFNFTLLTVDTHFTDGYQDDSCEDLFDKKYANAIYCSDKKVGEFIDWIKEQDFYDNTTIIITGDHLSMQAFFYRDDDNYQRTVYNTIINSSIEPEVEKNRLFTPFDMFPTTLASLGVKIDGDKLGLGVNLFSDKETLLEKLGLNELENELKAKSFFYDNELLKDHYYKMQKDLKNKEEVADEEVETD